MNQANLARYLRQVLPRHAVLSEAEANDVAAAILENWRKPGNWHFRQVYTDTAWLYEGERFVGCVLLSDAQKIVEAIG